MSRSVRSLCILLLLGVGVSAADALGAVSAEASGVRAGLDAWALLDDFEDLAWPDPGLWSLPPESQLTWRTSTCQAKHGLRGLRAFAGDRHAGEPLCDASVAAGTVSRLTMRLDLTETTLASRLDLFFELWLKMPAGDDQGLFIYLIEPQDVGPPTRIPIFGGTGMGGLWAYPRRLDLMNLENIEAPEQPIDLRGGVWDLEWVAYAPRGAPTGGGVFIDNVSLVWEPDPAVPTPTERVTNTPTATRQPTDEPTPSPRPTTATPTPEPDLRVFLPLLGFSVPETPTPTASETPATTNTPEGSATAAATGTPDGSATPVGTSTPDGSVTPDASSTTTPPSTSSPTVAPTTGTPPVTPGPMDWHIYLPIVQLVVEPATAPSATPTSVDGTIDPAPSPSATATPVDPAPGPSATVTPVDPAPSPSATVTPVDIGTAQPTPQPTSETPAPLAPRVGRTTPRSAAMPRGFSVCSMSA